MFCDTHVYLGNNGFAGEFGHTCVEIDGRPCGCGRRGCLETYVSGRGVTETAQEMLADNAVASMLRDTDQIQGVILFSRMVFFKEKDNILCIIFLLSLLLLLLLVVTM